jgi:hypothetical protein
MRGKATAIQMQSYINKKKAMHQHHIVCTELDWCFCRPLFAGSHASQPNTDINRISNWYLFDRLICYILISIFKMMHWYQFDNKKWISIVWCLFVISCYQFFWYQYIWYQIVIKLFDIKILISNNYQIDNNKFVIKFFDIKLLSNW